MPKNCIFAKFLPLGGFALWKKPLIGLFVDHLKMLLWGSITDKINQYLEQFTWTSHFCWVFTDRRLNTRHSTKCAPHCYSGRVLICTDRFYWYFEQNAGLPMLCWLWAMYKEFYERERIFEKIFLINFIDTRNSLSKHSIFADCWFIVS